MRFIKRCRLVSLCCGQFPFRFSLSALSFFIFRSSSFHSFSSFFIFEPWSGTASFAFFFSAKNEWLWGKCWHSSVHCITMPITSSSSSTVHHGRCSLVYQEQMSTHVRASTLPEGSIIVKDLPFLMCVEAFTYWVWYFLVLAAPLVPPNELLTCL